MFILASFNLLVWYDVMFFPPAALFFPAAQLNSGQFSSETHTTTTHQHQALNENMIHHTINHVDDAAKAEGAKKSPAKSRASKNGGKVKRNHPGLIVVVEPKPTATITNGYRFGIPMEKFKAAVVSVRNLRPTAQQQRRAHFKGKGNGKTAGIQYYNGSGKSAAFLKKLLTDNIPADIIKFPAAVEVHLTFHFKLPQKPAGKKVGDPYDRKIDLDNLQKLVFDAMSGIFYSDDSKVCTVFAEKVYGDFDGTTVHIMEK